MALNLLLVYLGCFFIVVGWMTYVILTQFVGWHIKVVALIIDASILLPPSFLAVLNEARGRQFWHQLKGLVSTSLNDTEEGFPLSTSRSEERTLGSFLLLPRYEDLAAKGMFMPLTYLVVGLLARRELFASQTLRPAIGVWLVFEVLIYQSRYLINDVRGRVEDNSASTLKRRFPGKYVSLPGKPVSEGLEDYALRLSFLALIFRMIIGITLFFTFAPPRYCTWLICLLFMIGFMVTTYLYEWTRLQTDRLFARSMTKEGNRGDALKSKSLAFESYSVVGLVGIGYSIRCLLALWLLGGFTWRVQLTLSLFAWSYGSMFVYMTWIIESTKTAPSAFVSKAHLRLLGNKYRVRYASKDGEFGKAGDVGPSDMILRVRQSPISVLTGLGVASQAAMVLLLRILIYGSTDVERFLLLLIVSLVCMIGSMTLPMTFEKSTPLPALFATTVGLIATILLLPSDGLSGPQRVLAVVGLGCSPLTVLAFRSCCDDDIEDAVFKFLQKYRRRFTVIPKWFIGGNVGEISENITVNTGAGRSEELSPLAKSGQILKSDIEGAP